MAKEMIVYDVVYSLTGEIRPVGEHYTDKARNENLGEMIELVGRLLCDIYYVAENRNRQEDSMKRAGERAHEFILSLADFLPENNNGT